MSPPASVDYEKLAASLCRGIADGNRELVTAIVTAGDKRHELRDTVQQTVDKNWEIDGELKLLKGVMVTLVGDGSGASGLVNRLEKEVHGIGTRVTTLTTEVSGLRGDMERVAESIDILSKAQSKNRSFMDGWKGVGIFLGIVGTCLTIMGSLIAGLIWLFTHGVSPK